jgi:hypothetical protein
VRREERDETGRLVYASKSNYGSAMDEAFPGPKRAVRRADVQTGVTPGVGTNTFDQQFRIPEGTGVATGLTRR